MPIRLFKNKFSIQNIFLLLFNYLYQFCLFVKDINNYKKKKKMYSFIESVFRFHVKMFMNSKIFSEYTTLKMLYTLENSLL